MPKFSQRTKLWILAAASIAICCVGAIQARNSSLLQWADHQFLGAFLSIRGSRQASDKVFIVGITEKTYSTIPGNSSLWGFYHSEVIDKLSSTGARGIAYDIFFPPPKQVENDGNPIFVQVAELEKQSTTAMAVSVAKSCAIHDCPVLFACFFDGEELRIPDSNLWEVTGNGLNALGFINLLKEPMADSVTWEAAIQRRGVEESAPVVSSLPFQLSHVLLGDDPQKFLGSSDSNMNSININYVGPPGTFGMVSFEDLLAANAEQLEQMSSLWKGKVVLIGDWEQPTDLVQSPFIAHTGKNLMSGVELIANIADTIISGRSLEKAPIIWLIVICLVAMLLSLFAILKLNHWLNVVVDMFLVALIVFVTYQLFVQDYMSYPSAGILAMTTNSAAFRFGKSWFFDRERKMLAKYFSHYVSPYVVSKIIEENLGFLQQGKQYELAILFVDIRQFTKLSESVAPNEITSFLSDYYDIIGDVTCRNKGWVDKFMGDGALVVFGFPGSEKSAAIDATQTAFELLSLAREMYFPGVQESLAIGISLHYGNAVIGNVGKTRKIDFTVIGDLVNTVVKLQSACKTFSTPIVASAKFINQIGVSDISRVESLGQFEAPGKSSMDVFKISKLQP